MEKRLCEFIRNGDCWNDVAFRFAEMVLAEHLFIDPNSIEPSQLKSNPISKVAMFKRIYHDFGVKQLNDGRQS
jgi:hypothetical protein